ncbi:MAG TPA: hypothetical protein VLA88_01810 [Candidatus Saccharimonadales bacterium]|nr:hypothetical protein [Candidatus Saccharimonadales bacterium]
MPVPPTNAPTSGAPQRPQRLRDKKKPIIIGLTIAAVLTLCCCGGGIAAIVAYVGADKVSSANAAKEAQAAVQDIVICKKVTYSANNVTYDAVETSSDTFVVAKGTLEGTDDYDGRSRDAQQAAEEYRGLTPGNKYRVATSDIGDTFGTRNLWVLTDLGPTNQCGGMLGN